MSEYSLPTQLTNTLPDHQPLVTVSKAHPQSFITTGTHHWNRPPSTIREQANIKSLKRTNTYLIANNTDIY